MRLIDADAFREYWKCGTSCENCEQNATRCGYEQIFSRMDICSSIDDAQTVEAVPLKPLTEWLARYCMPPQNTPIHDIFRKSRGEIYGYLTVEWEQFLRGMNWTKKEVDDGKSIHAE